MALAPEIRVPADTELSCSMQPETGESYLQDIAAQRITAWSFAA
jgi:hypothetical protein